MRVTEAYDFGPTTGEQKEACSGPASVSWGEYLITVEDTINKKKHPLLCNVRGCLYV